jgi:hypothetical protein
MQGWKYLKIRWLHKVSRYAGLNIFENPLAALGFQSQ